MKLRVPDLVSPSYFPALAAIDLGCIADRGVEISFALDFPVTASLETLRSHEVDFVCGTASSLLISQAGHKGLKLLGALSHGTYWFLVVKSELGLKRGDSLTALKGLSIGAAPGVDETFKQLLMDEGLEPGDVTVAPVPGVAGPAMSFGVTAVEAMKQGLIDGFWANGMAADIATREGVGTLIVDARRDFDRKSLTSYTFAALMTSEKLEQEQPEAVRAVLGGLVDAQQQLRADSMNALPVAERVFPAMEAGLTPALIARDSPSYFSAITETEIEGVLAFAKLRGQNVDGVGYDDIVSDLGRDLWVPAP